MEAKVPTESDGNYLISHLAKVKNEREFVLKEFYPVTTPESIEFEKFMTGYISSIENYIKCGAKVAEGKSMHIPVVLIGSTVDIQDTDDQSTEKIHIVSPFLNQGQVNYTFASYLSPMGRTLLLKKKGEEIEARLPAGCFHYMINDIRHSCC